MRCFADLCGASLLIGVCIFALAACIHEPSGTETSFSDQIISISDSDLVALAVDEKHDYVYLADANLNAIHVIPKNDLNKWTSVTLAGPPLAMDTSDDGKRVFVAVAAEPAIQIINVTNPGSPVVEDSISLGVGVTPSSIAVATQNRLYVGADNSDNSKAIRAFNISGAPWPELSTVSNIDGYIAGRSQDRTILYTSDEGQASTNGDEPLISKWDLTNEAPQFVISGTLFGTSARRNGWVLSIPMNNEEILVYGQGVEGEDGSVFDDGVMPIYNANSFVSNESLFVEYQAIAAAVTPDGARLVVAHDNKLPVNSSPADRHDMDRKDIHIFDMELRQDVAFIETSDLVHSNGLAIDNDLTVYALLGRETANKLGVYKR